MSDIYVNADGLSKSLLQSARDTVNNAMGHAIAYDYDIFSYETCSELVQAHDQLRAIQGKLDSYMSILNSAPEELVAIDTKQKGKQTTWWQRTKYQARQVISNIIGRGNIVSVGSSLIGAAFLLNWLFGSNRSVVGGASEIDSGEETESETNTEETPEEKYGEMADQYDWSKTDTTREAAIAVAAAAAANGQDPEQAVKEYYEAHSYELELHSYQEGVQKGQIRYVDQLHNLEENGWGGIKGNAYHWCDCGAESMALSYMGIDASPEYQGTDRPLYASFADYQNGNNTVNIKGNTVRCEQQYESPCSMDNLNQRVNNFQADAGKGDVSPVMIHYVNYDSIAYYENGEPVYNQHWMIITGKNSDGTYNVIGPAEGQEVITVTIENGVIREIGDKPCPGGGISHDYGTIDKVAQYTRVSE